MQQEKVQRWHSNDNFILRTVGGENVLVQIGDSPDPRLDNCMISLNETSAFLWNFFAEGDHSEEEAIQAACAEYTAQPGEIEAHIHEYVVTYAEIGLLQKEE